MDFRVKLASGAFTDLDTISGYIASRGSLESASKWFFGIMDAIASLKTLPQRCPAAREARGLDLEVRVLLHGRARRRYKIYFAIVGSVVVVFHVRHWARKSISLGELKTSRES